jgi:hypothetical protein
MPRRTFPHLGQVNSLGVGHTVLEGAFDQLGPDPDFHLGSRLGCRASRSLKAHLSKLPHRSVLIGVPQYQTVSFVTGDPPPERDHGLSTGRQCG